MNAATTPLQALFLAPTPPHLVTTLQLLRDHGACREGYRKLCEAIRDQFAVTPEGWGMDRPIPLAAILETNGLDDALWCLRAVGSRSKVWQDFCRLLACDFAEHALEHFERWAPDDKRPRQCIEAVRGFVAGTVTWPEVETARAAAADADAAAAAAARHWQAGKFREALAGAAALCAATADKAGQGARCPGAAGGCNAPEGECIGACQP